MTDKTIEELIDEALAPEDAPVGLPPAEVLEAIGEHGAEELRAQLAPELDAWQITGENTALWAANKLRMAEARRAAAAATARELYAVADAHQAAIDAATEWDLRYFTGKLRQYHEQAIAGSKRKTTPLPGGIKLKSAIGSVTTEIDNEDELVAWLEEHPEVPALEYPDPKVSKAELAGFKGKLGTEAGDYPAVTEATADPETGEVAAPEEIPGMHYTRKPPRFDVVIGELVPDQDDEE